MCNKSVKSIAIKKISIIIPILNEAENISSLLDYLGQIDHQDFADIIVVDGGSTDGSVVAAQKFNALVLESKPGRATQMNLGAQKAKGEILYFLHADTLPPKTLVSDINESVQNGYKAGCYRFKFMSSSPLLKINSWFTRFNFYWCRGGDQSLFITKEFFDELEGYVEDYCIMEEYELLERVNDVTSFIIMPKDILVSARKYEQNGYFKVNLVNLKAMRMFRKGIPCSEIKEYYNHALKNELKRPY